MKRAAFIKRCPIAGLSLHLFTTLWLGHFYFPQCGATAYKKQFNLHPVDSRNAAYQFNKNICNDTYHPG